MNFGGSINKTNILQMELLNLEQDFNGEYYFTKNISALAYVNMKQYSSEVTKSPITEDRIITNVGAGLKIYILKRTVING